MSTTGSTTPLANVAGTWQLDPKSTIIEIHTKAMWGLAQVKGTFRAVSGSAVIGEQGAVSGELVVDAASIDTKKNRRDEHLRGDDFFSASEHPTFTFAASQAIPAPDGSLKIRGALRIKDQSHLIELDARMTTPSPDRVALSAETTIDRSQWGISWAKMGAGLVNRIVVVAQFVRSEAL